LRGISRTHPTNDPAKVERLVEVPLTDNQFVALVCVAIAAVIVGLALWGIWRKIKS